MLQGSEILMTATAFQDFATIVAAKLENGSPAAVESCCRRKAILIPGREFLNKRDKGEFDGHSSSLEIAATHESSSPEAACYTIFQRHATQCATRCATQSATQRATRSLNSVQQHFPSSQMFPQLLPTSTNK